MSVSTPPLQACRTCEHGRNIRRVSGGLGICDLQHETLYRIPEHEHDDQGGYHCECADWKCRAEVIDAEEDAAETRELVREKIAIDAMHEREGNQND